MVMNPMKTKAKGSIARDEGWRAIFIVFFIDLANVFRRSRCFQSTTTELTNDLFFPAGTISFITLALSVMAA